LLDQSYSPFSVLLGGSIEFGLRIVQFLEIPLFFLFPLDLSFSPPLKLHSPNCCNSFLFKKPSPQVPAFNAGDFCPCSIATPSSDFFLKSLLFPSQLLPGGSSSPAHLRPVFQILEPLVSSFSGVCSRRGHGVIRLKVFLFRFP